MDSPRRTRNRVACRRCQRRKIRCDGDLPSCGACQKVGAACVNDGKQEVHRLYIANMENRMRWLESLVRDNCPDVDLNGGISGNENRGTGEQMQPDVDLPEHDEQDNFAPVQEGRDTQTVNDEPHQGHEIGLVSLSSGEGPPYIGPSSGYFFARRILSNARCPGSRQPSAADIPGSTNLSELLNTPASLPPRKEITVELSARYFQTVHLLYPFLHEPSHAETIERVHTSPEKSPLDLFQVFMVLAIAALDLSHHAKVHLPVEGYYTAAMKHVDDVCGDGSVRGLQSLLLLMVYALHNPSCRVNIWNLNYQCLASVIDLGLQQDVLVSSSFGISVREQEIRTRVFWVTYTFDRVICTMMGRPIGLRDEACDLRLPLDIADLDLVDTRAAEYSQPSPLVYSIHLFKLSRMNSEIKYIMHSISRDTPAYAYPPVRDILTWQRDMANSLKAWFSNIPQQQGSGRMTGYCKARYHETMVFMLRPSLGIPAPSDQSLDLCFKHAVESLHAFGKLYGSGHLLYSRLIAHSVLLNTLVMLHCIWKVPMVAARCRINELVADFNISQNILSSIGEYWDEANRARDWIGELSSVTLQRLFKNRSTADSRASESNRRRSRPNHVRAPSEVTRVHCLQSESELSTRPERCNFGGSVDSAIDPYQHEDQVDDRSVNYDSTNLFDDLLQEHFQGWNSMSDIDGLMWEFFH